MLGTDLQGTGTLGGEGGTQGKMNIGCKVNKQIRSISLKSL